MSKSQDISRLQRLKDVANSLPEKPGSYQFHDSKGIIIYVGKAKNLKARVSSYFHKEVDRFKTKVLVSKIYNITYTVVNTEEDALLLENSLIKKYTPHYNILLKDGKTYPSIVITNELFPRILKTRTIDKRFGTYYGPYSHTPTMHALLDVIQRVCKPRSCRTSFTLEGIKSGRYKSCLEYHIENCKAPCIAKQSLEEYRETIVQAQQILKGNTREVSEQIYNEMLRKAEELKFEEAEELKKQYILLENFQAKSEVVSYSINDVDVFSISKEDSDNNSYINFLHVKNGMINQSFTFEYKSKLDETEEDILLTAIFDIRERFSSTAKEIILPFIPQWQLPYTTVSLPQRGDKKRLLELSQLNCRQYRIDRLKQAEKLNPEQKQTRLLKELQQKLSLTELPYHIECFDNSNISGTTPVAACVVFKGLKPSKRDYRKYNIKTVEGSDDYASMREVVRRRYTHIMEESNDEIEKNLPNLIIADGGKGQMSVINEVVNEELQLNIPIAGLAKDGKHRTNELLFGFPPQHVSIDPKSELFFALTRIQDEVHRFAITFHRKKRNKAILHSSLDEIKGIGEITKKKLLSHFKTIKNIKSASIEDLSKIIGNKKALILQNQIDRIIS